MEEGDAVRGKKLYDARAAQCHATGPAANKTGPTLFGVYGRLCASAPAQRPHRLVRPRPPTKRPPAAVVRNPRLQTAPAPMAAGPGFGYSQANRDARVVWDDENLHRFLENPRKFMPGNKMAFAGMKNARDRADIIAYIK
eukprot:EG_transcript_42596